MLDGGEDGGVEGSNKLRFKVLKGEGQAYVWPYPPPAEVKRRRYNLASVSSWAGGYSYA